ncbi:MAG TPA: PepSY-associated TM helix domain-containing protein [Opitutaceae bacterium]
MSFRKTLFWVHLVAGVVAGGVIGIMSFTGAVLAFETEIVAWAERDARRVAPPAIDAPRLALDELLQRVRAHDPEARPTGITVSADRRDAVMFAVGRDIAYYVNPYTGEVRQPASTAVHDFMRTMVEWHRWLAMSGDHRATGKAITGACNTAFLILGLTGLYLWWPRNRSWRALKPSVWFLRDARGKARDWNWHNVIGFWSLPVLIVLTASGMVISYRWAGNLVYRAAGEQPPAQPGPGGLGGAAVDVPRPDAGARRLGYEALLVAAQQDSPGWATIALRLGNPRAAGARPRAASNVPATQPDTSAGPERRVNSGSGERRGPQAVTVVIREGDRWPRTASTTLTLNPFTGDVLRREAFSDLSTGRQARLWLRFLHTGQALGWAGQLVAGLACVGGGVLVWTGFALAWRRFFGRRPKAAAAAEPAVVLSKAQ